MRSKAQTDAAIAEGNPRRAGAPENQILATGPACLAWRHLNIEDCPVMIETTVPSGELTYRGIVYPWHCDHMGHMNVMWYVGKFDHS